MTTEITVDWSEFEAATGEDALNSIRTTRYYQAARSLARQKVNPQTVYDRYVKKFPTREAGARVLSEAVRYLQQIGVEQ